MCVHLLQLVRLRRRASSRGTEERENNDDQSDDESERDDDWEDWVDWDWRSYGDFYHKRFVRFRSDDERVTTRAHTAWAAEQKDRARRAGRPAYATEYYGTMRRNSLAVGKVLRRAHLLHERFLLEFVREVTYSTDSADSTEEYEDDGNEPPSPRARFAVPASRSRAPERRARRASPPAPRLRDGGLPYFRAPTADRPQGKKRRLASREQERWSDDENPEQPPPPVHNDHFSRKTPIDRFRPSSKPKNGRRADERDREATEDVGISLASLGECRKRRRLREGTSSLLSERC